MSRPMLVTLTLFVLAYGGVALVLVRHRLLGRLAVRSAGRRRVQGALLACGLAVATGAVTGGLIAADSVDRSSLEMVYRDWGYVDVTVSAGQQLFPRDVADRIAADRTVAANTDGVAAGLDLPASVSVPASGDTAPEVTLSGFDPAAQRPFGEFELTDGGRTTGADLGPDDVLLSEALARRLGLGTGDRVRLGVGDGGKVAATGESAGLRVAGIARPEGPGGATLRPVAFARLETVQRLAGVDRADRINVVRISAEGGVRAGEAASRRAAAALEPVVTELVRTAPAGQERLEVREVKASDLESAKVGMAIFRAVLIAMSAMVAAVGALLIVNLVWMLALERRPQSGTLRALGLSRRGLVGLSVGETAVYGLVAAALGAGLGAVAGRVVSDRVGNILTAYASQDDMDIPFSYTLRPLTLVAGFATGALLTLLVAAAASRRTARLDIAAALRDLPEPPHTGARRPWRRRVGLGLATLAGGAALIPPYLPRMAGGAVLILVLTAVLGRRLPSRIRVSIAGLAVTGWCVAASGSTSPDADPGAWVALFVGAQLITAFALTVLVAANLPLLGVAFEAVIGAVGGASARLAAVLRPALTFPARRPLRTGLTSGVFAVVVAMLTVFAVMDATTRPDVERTANGFDVVVQAAGSDGVRVPGTVDAEVRRSVTLAHRTYVGPVGGDDPFAAVERVSHPLYRASPDLADQPPLRLASRDDRYADDAAVWRAVATDPTLTVSSLGAVGSIVTLRGDAGPVRLTVVGTPPVGLLGGAFLSDRALRAFGAAAAGITVLLDVRSPSAADAVARAMQQSVADRGGRAVSVLALLESVALADRAFQDMITVLMRMGLLVGVLGLGIVALRVATERRQVIGILRAIGYRRRDVALSLLVESAVVTTLGTVVGVVTGLAMGYAVSRGSGSGAFGIDIGLIGGVLAVVYLAAFAVTVLPAWQASRLPPARAVRLGS